MASRHSKQKGQGLVEFVLILPILLLLIMAIMDFGRALIVYAQGSNAVRDAVRYAQVWGSEDTHPYLDCETIQNLAQRVMFADVDVTIDYESQDEASLDCSSSDSEFSNGDVLVVSSVGRFRFMTPFLSNLFPSFEFRFRAQRTIVKDLLLEGGSTGSVGNISCNIPDNPNTVVVCVYDITVNESDGTATFTVEVAPDNHNRNISVQYETYDGSGIAGRHYTSANGTLNFAPGQTIKTVTVGLIDDDVVDVSDPDKSFYLVLSNAVNAEILYRRARATIVDNDTTPAPVIDTSRRIKVQRIDNSSGGQIQNTLQLINTGTVSIPLNQVTVRYWFTSDASAGTTFNSYVCPGTCTFQSTSKDMADQYMQIAFGGSTTLAPGAISNGHQFQISKNPYSNFTHNNDWSNVPSTSGHVYADAPNITVYWNGQLIGGTEPGVAGSSSWPRINVRNSKSNFLVEEGEVASFFIELASASTQNVSINYTLSGSATLNSDYSVSGSSSPVTFSPGETVKEVIINVTNDTLYEQNETITLQISNPTNAHLGTNLYSTLTIPTNDVQPTVNVRSSTSSVNEGGSVDFIVEISPAPSQQVSVNYAIGGTATLGSDYSVSGPGSPLVFNAGETSKTISISTLNDTDPETDESVTVTLSNAVNVTLGTASATSTILANDLPTVSVRSASPTVTEGDSTSFIIEVSPASPLPVTVSYSFTGTAQSPGDYTASGLSSPVTFAANETSKTISIATVNDTTPEGDETITVTLGAGPTNAMLGTATATVTIPANDPELSVSLNPSSADEGLTATFTVSLSAPSATPVTVDYALTGNATFASDYTNPDLTSANGTITFAANEISKQYVFTIVNDTDAEPNENVIFTLSNPSGAVLGTAVQTLSIPASDKPELSIAVVGVSSVIEGSTKDFTIGLSQAYTETITVQCTTGAGSSPMASASDFSFDTGGGRVACNGGITFTPGQTTKTVRLVATADAVDEYDEQVTLTLSSQSSNAIISQTNGSSQVIIVDNNNAPTATISSPTALETASSITFNVTLTPASAKTVRIYFTVSPGTATLGNDYSMPSPLWIDFAAGETSKPFVVTLIPNNVASGSETFTVSMTSQDGNAVISGAGTGTLQDVPSITKYVQATMVHYGGAGNGQINGNVQLRNTSTTTSLNLNGVSIRYWFTTDGATTGSLSYQCPSNATCSIQSVTGYVNANAYLQILFNAGAGSIAANSTGSNTYVVYVQRPGNIAFDYNNDHSYVAATSWPYISAPNVTIHNAAGDIIGGTAPALS